MSDATLALAPARLGVLVVDDEPQILTAITDLLEGEFTVLTAGDGAAALEILRHSQVTVILSDQRMPGMSGAEFLGRARSLSSATRVLVTGYSDLDALVAAVNLGQIHAYLSKPWNPLELKVVMRTAADRWRLRQTLDQEHSLLLSLMDSTPDSIFFKDRALTFVRVNQAEAELLGAGDALDVVGLRLSDLMAAEQAAAIEEEERRIIETGTPVLDQMQRITDPRGVSRWYSITKVPIRQDGEITGLVGVARDVTARKEAEDFLQGAHDRLQAAVDERTSWLQHEIQRRASAEQQAQAAREAAESASRAKTVFLANMSHELRTPLNAILGFSELAGSLMTPPEQQRFGGFFGDIGESAHHLLKVISDILDVSRIEAGKINVQEGPVNLAEIIDSVGRLIAHAVAAKGHILEVDVAPGLPPLLGDGRLVKQMLLNLVSNASKFTPSGGHLRVAAEVEAGAIRVMVEDDGIGIAPADIPMVLQPFGQAANAISPKQEGTGLGLPLARGFAELHGGSLSLDSAPGQGTRVTVSFPATRTLA